MDYENIIQNLNIHLPPPPTPAGSYQPIVIAGTSAYLSGQISRKADGQILAGKVGKDLTLTEGKEAAKIAAGNVLSLIRHFVGFDRFERILRVVGYVQAAPDFYDIAQVVNGASDLFLEVFGKNGVHARSSIGVASLPLNAAVEIEVTLQIITTPLKPKRSS